MAAADVDEATGEVLDEVVDDPNDEDLSDMFASPDGIPVAADTSGQTVAMRTPEEIERDYNAREALRRYAIILANDVPGGLVRYRDAEGYSLTARGMRAAGGLCKIQMQTLRTSTEMVEGAGGNMVFCAKAKVRVVVPELGWAEDEGAGSCDSQKFVTNKDTGALRAATGEEKLQLIGKAVSAAALRAFNRLLGLDCISEEKLAEITGAKPAAQGKARNGNGGSAKGSSDTDNRFEIERLLADVGIKDADEVSAICKALSAFGGKDDAGKPTRWFDGKNYSEMEGGRLYRCLESVKALAQNALKAKKSGFADIMAAATKTVEGRKAKWEAEKAEAEGGGDDA